MSITAQRAQEFGIERQRENESGHQFRCRVSGELRAQGHIVEAHEAYQNALYDDSEDVMTGIFGAMAQLLQGNEYSPHNGERQVGDDIATGLLSQQPKDDATGLLTLLSVLIER